jgi:SpoVK/Ycf46/Vps4 family AAA+-type ATPase
MTSDATAWNDSNQRYLSLAMAGIKARLRLRMANEKVDESKEKSGNLADEDDRKAKAELDIIRSSMQSPPALDMVCLSFGLSGFERDLLLLCAGVELDSSFAYLLANAQGGFQYPYPTFGLALAALQDAHWSAISPASPLRRWRLIEVDDSGTLTTSPIKIEERVLHYLAGVSHLDERLAGIVEPADFDDEIFPSQRTLAQSIAASWQKRATGSQLPAIELYGSDAKARRSIALTAARILGLNLYSIDARSIPADPGQFISLLRIWERDSALCGAALLLECGSDLGDSTLERQTNRLIDRVGCPLMISSERRRRDLQRAVISFDIKKPSRDEQRALWTGCMGSEAFLLDGELDAVVSEFDLSSHAIRNAWEELVAKRDTTAAVSGKEESDREKLKRDLWNACRSQVRPNLETLAQRIEPVATWEDLVLPPLQKQILHDISAHVKNRARVYGDWGFERKLSLGLGITVLFSGTSGTGKTMAAEVLANELGLDLYRIDLSSVVSKYIGETEKNLKRVFDAAEEGGSILLFDEADALFGKRSEVRDSHDRYANIEVSYLLQRMEAYRGLAILTTNMKGSLDPAFMRRIRFAVQFPFPDAAQRAEIWMHIFPKEAPRVGLDMQKLARLNVTGGNIKNIALYSAFLAAEESVPIGMSHLLHAARVEYAKLEKPLTEAEIGSWI